jgi:hypothetical protein
MIKKIAIGSPRSDAWKCYENKAGRRGKQAEEATNLEISKSNSCSVTVGLATDLS